MYINRHGERPYFVGKGAIQVAGDGRDNITLGDSVVTGVREALATTAAAAAAAATATGAAAALALIDLSGTGPHRYSAATLWGFKWLTG